MEIGSWKMPCLLSLSVAYCVSRIASERVYGRSLFALSKGSIMCLRKPGRVLTAPRMRTLETVHGRVVLAST